MRNLNKYNFSFNKPITSWDEALALGNGKLGSLLYGDGPIRIAVDRGDLWDNRPDEYTLEEGFNFPNLVKLSTSGKDEDWNGERYRLFEYVSRRVPYPTKLTAGRIELDFGEKTQDISSGLDITKAIATLSVKKGTLGKIELFLSATRFIGVAKIFGNVKLNLHVPTYFSGGENGKMLNNSGIDTVKDGCLYYPCAQIIEDGEFSYYLQKTHTDYQFGIVALTIDKGDYKELYYTVATTDDGANFIELAKNQLKKQAEDGYDVLMAEHVAWWKNYWNKSQITINDQLFEKTYYRSYYLFASCSREGFVPMPLQGVWTADNDSVPPWNGDYHHDTNTQMSYQCYLKGNRLPEGKVFIDYIWKLRDTFRAFTKRFYRVNGLIIPATMSLNGTAIGGWAHYTLSPTMTIWVAQSFDEYWLYTGDKSFLRKKAYPFFKEVGKAIYALLEERNGKLYLPLSSSPEIYDNERRAYLKPNSNFDLSLLIYLYKTLKGYCEILGKDAGKYEDILNKLDAIAINEEHMIMLDSTQNLKESHRHFSHLMCLYPLHLVNFDSEENKLIYNQTMFHIERLGTGWWIAFSFSMCAQIYAMMRNGGASYEKLRIFCKGCVADNGFNLNGDYKRYGFSQWHYRPFTLEGLFGYCDALQEMLLQDHNGFIEVFPAIPEEWQKKVSFKNLRSYKGVLVSASYKDGKPCKVVLKSRRKNTVELLNNFGCDNLIVQRKNETLTVNVKQGETVKIELDGRAVTIQAQA